jgi:tRNA threonylcarbamoyladenosine biosynthesis protein TsaB
VTVLAVETATSMVGVALVAPDGRRAERCHFEGRLHAELLAPAIAEVCDELDVPLSDIDLVVADCGPGLFTGLRVGVATAKAMAQALGVPTLGVSSLDVLAAAAFPHRDGRCVVSVVDARRGEVFAAAYGPGPEEDPAANRQEWATPVTPEQLESWLDGLIGHFGPLMVVGDGAVRYADRLAGNPGLDLTQAPSLAAPPPGIMADLARLRRDAGVPLVAAGDLMPDYRRPADAQINWEQRRPPVVPGPAA